MILKTAAAILSDKRLIYFILPNPAAAPDVPAGLRYAGISTEIGAKHYDASPKR